MKQHYIFRMLGISLVLLGFSACKKQFLELSPISNANVNAVFKTKADFTLAVNNAYSTLYTIYAPKGSISFTGELMSDNVTVSTLAISGSFTIVDQQAFRDYSITPTNSGVLNFWNDHYRSLYQVNIVLDKIEGADVDDAFKKQVRGEMKFLRALYYFNLVRLFGPIPLVDKVITDQEAYAMKRSSEADAYKLITDDLRSAVADLTEPGSEPAVGRANKGAAKTLLGKVYLTQGDKTNAATVLQEVYTTYGNGAKYDLLPSFQGLWGNSTGQKNTKESIFEVQYQGGVGNPYSSYWPAFAPFENFAITKYGGGMNMVTDDLYNEYEPGDLRRDISFHTGYTKNGVFVPVRFNKKWVDLTAALDGGQEACNNNFILLRYADVLLMLTEATGDVQYLNRVRARAGLPAYGTSGYPATYNTVALALEHERRMEFALEFHRWFDLKRTGRAVTVLSAKGKAVNANKLLLPIPQYALNQNPNLQPQNPGY